jgi:hypothetical protein
MTNALQKGLIVYSSIVSTALLAALLMGGETWVQAIR